MDINTVTISIDRFKELESIEKIYREKSNSHRLYGSWTEIRTLTNDQTIELLKEEVKYYRDKLDALPKWFKKLYPNSCH